jgi:ubiquinone/menaquinone biosynthesis C-methylase UbiE
MPDGTDVYVTVMVPRLFAPWAELLVDSLAPAPGSTALDVGTGPGTVARVIARRVGAIGRVYGCDSSASMVAAARGFAPQSGAATIEYLACTAEQLPLADAGVDAITCQHALPLFPDRAGALTEMRRVARPGARLAASVWRTVEEMPIFAALAGAARDVVGPAGDLYTVPFSLGEPALLRELALSTGWRDVEVSPRDLPIEFASVEEVVRCYATTPMADAVAALDADRRAALTEAVRHHLGPHVDHDGAVRSTTGGHFLTATA